MEPFLILEKVGCRYLLSTSRLTLGGKGGLDGSDWIRSNSLL